VNWKIIHIDETDSTNRWLHNEFSAGKLEVYCRESGSLPSVNSVVVVTDYQTAGRGCGTNTWESERGKNLLFSIMMHPTDIAANEQFRITEIVSVALCQTLQAYIKNKVEIKWPNDIYVGDRKICGILIENRLQGNTIKESIIGIGVNVNQTEFKSDAPNPVSIRQLTGNETDLEELLQAFLHAFDVTSHSKTTCFDYKSMLYRRGKYANYEDKTSCFTATLTDVLSDGRLLLVDKDGQKRLYAFKEVQFVM
jgi:BirA family biotin operon repressor/biotin-[acetyl-CoA-carboxylase] ligase